MKITNTAQVVNLSTTKLKRLYFRTQRKVWRIERKKRKSIYSATYDPYDTFKSLSLDLSWYQALAVDTAEELRRREVWLGLPRSLAKRG